ncbi:MAG: amino acid ABC transporter permease [Atopobiaceae bacterium]|jgi:putative lysine transport system permease protein|nr:amino acid ABC transporter permease [Atopobiaceae bacterium]MCI1317853.1 amino acid ABC transporter permease [Atopobiaceae bacterium]MCI1389704.1 amino acid ABC transporter permease [Atopobiaceae bacterium]MCI1431894.1 amino acid ABC transporter permease [Atopobiaceae bacterium]MCI1470330.1 amino acid ABC transporter permease [Atopobiaceae bacterium]
MSEISDLDDEGAIEGVAEEVADEEVEERRPSALRRFGSFLRRDHRYVFLGTDVFAAFGLWLLSFPVSALGFIAGGSVADVACRAILCAWLAVSLLAFAVKATHWGSYETTFLKRPSAMRVERICSYVVWAVVLVVAYDRIVLGFASIWQYATTTSSNPSDFISSATYMVYASRSMYAQGISTTLELAIFGTAIAFVFALLLVFLRIQEPGRSDNDFVKFLKTVGRDFAEVYSTIVRGTPMMVQGLIIYSFGFSVVRGMGYSVSEVTHVWTYFRAGLVIISLNSTAYIMEALRGGIEAVDPGQAEAARSLGLTQWQAMTKVVFPQGVRNAIPALSNEVVINIKDSSVLSVVGVFDLMFATTTVAGIYYRQMEVYVVAALIYLLMTYIATRILTWISKKLDVEAPSPMTNSN